MSEDSTVRTPAPVAAPGAKRKTPALGRGLGALLGDTRRDEPTGAEADGVRSEGLAVLRIAEIEPHPEQPRRHFDEQALDELAASIAQRGVIQPIVVRSLPNGRYQLVAGERRWRAAQRAQLHEIPALIRTLTDRDVKVLALIENLQREDLNPIEEARAFQRLADEEGLTQSDIAKMVDKSRSHVANLQRLLGLPEPVIRLVEAGSLSMGHARALIGSEVATQIAELAVAKGLSVREVEAMIRKSARGDISKPRRARVGRNSADDADIAAVESHLEELLGLPVKISADSDPASGSVTIRYRTLDQLDLVCQRLSGGVI